MLIENTKDTLIYLKDVKDIEFKKTSETVHSTNVQFLCKKNNLPVLCELIIWSNPKKISTDSLIAKTDKDKIIIDDKFIKIIDKNNKTLILEYFLNVNDEIVLHLNY